MMTPPPSPEPIEKPEPPGRKTSLIWFRIFLTLVVAGLVVFFTLVWITREGMNSAKETVVGVVELFRPEEVITTFREWRELDAEATGGNILEIATAEASERFTRTSNVAMFGRVLPLSTTVSEIIVPATYRFHIDLDEEWNLVSDGNRLIVQAPAVRPSLPVAFDSAGVQKKTQ